MIDRRKFTGGLGGLALGLGATGGTKAARAQDNGVSSQMLEEFSQILIEAERLGLDTPRLTAGLAPFNAETMVPAVSDVLANFERSALAAKVRSVTRSDDVEKLIERTAELLRKAVTSDTAPSEGRLDATTRSLSLQARPALSALKEEYEQLFKACEIRSERRSTVAWYVNRLKDPESQARYKAVEDKVCAPWFFIGIIHGMEAGFNFRGHLHNGDSLSARTRNIPADRPEKWDPPNDWETSAVDAIKYDGFVDIQDWSLASMLYRWEAYNGFRSRTIHNIKTPYLWSFSQHYTRGKYVRDNVWSPTAVSNQCGAAVMLKVLVDEGIVIIPSA